MATDPDKKIPLVEMFGPVLQGEGVLIGAQTTFLRFGLCDYKCKMCIEASQRVLMADWSYKPISQLLIGDMVMGSYKDPTPLSRLVIRPVKVLDVFNQGSKPVLEVSTPNGKLVCTPDHKLLNVKWRNYWQPAETCLNAMLCTLPVYEPQGNYWLGWLHGLFAGDGSIHKFKDRWWRMKVSMQQSDHEAIDKAHELLTHAGLDSHLITHIGNSSYAPLCGVEVTNHKQVSVFREQYLEGMPNDLDYMRGWIAGFHDTDGHWDPTTGSVRISQTLHCNAWKISRLKDYLYALGIPYNTQQSVSNRGNAAETVIVSRVAELFSQCKPVLLRKYPESFGIGKYPDMPVTEIAHLESPAEVWDITTESGDFIVEGILAHNCDSMHAVDPNKVRANATWFTQEEIANGIIRLNRQFKTPWVTLSGGNPCIHELDALCGYLHDAGIKISVETQGTFAPEWLRRVDQLTVSPKGPGMGAKFVMKTFMDFMDHVSLYGVTQRTSLKVVLFSTADIEFLKTINEIAYAWGMEDRVFASVGNPDLPGINDEYSFAEHRRILLDGMAQNLEDLLKEPTLGNVRFLPQLHVLLYGNRQGV